MSQGFIASRLEALSTLPEILGEKSPQALKVSLGDLTTLEGLCFGLLSSVVLPGVIYEALFPLCHWRRPSLGHGFLDAVGMATSGDDHSFSADGCLGDHALPYVSKRWMIFSTSSSSLIRHS